MKTDIGRASQIDWKAFLDHIAHDLREAYAHLEAGYFKDMWMELTAIHKNITTIKSFVERGK